MTTLLNNMLYNALIQRRNPQSNLWMLNTVSKDHTDESVFKWDVVVRSAPDKQPEYTPLSANMIYTREKMEAQPATLVHLRNASENNEKSVKTLTDSIMMQFYTLNSRIDRLAELSLFCAATGKVSFENAGTIVDIDYKFDPAHRLTNVNWSRNNTKGIELMIQLWANMIHLDSKVKPTTVFASENVMNIVFNKFAGDDRITANMMEVYRAMGVLPSFLGFDWQLIPGDFSARSSELENAFLMGNYKANRPLTLVEGPAIDLEAPENYVGKFVKAWTEQDPSGLLLLMEYNFLPVVYRPDQMMSAKIV